MSFKGFFVIFSSGSHFVQWSGTISAILEEGHQNEHSCDFFLKLGHYSRRCHLKKLLTDDGQISITIAHLEHFVLR